MEQLKVKWLLSLMEKNKLTTVLALTSVILLTVGQLYFPLALLVGIAPLLAIYKTNERAKFKHFDFVIFRVLLISQLVIAYFKAESLLVGGSVAIMMWLTFVLFSFTDKHAKNKLGVFTIIVYWLAAEYLLLLLFPSSAHFLLGAGFDNFSSIDWSGYTGITGISTWILISNALFYYALFYGENNVFTGSLRPISITYAIVGAALPLIVLSFFDYESSKVTAALVEQYYKGLPVDISPYNIDGEVFARSIGWVSALIAIYAIVKRKVK